MTAPEKLKKVLYQYCLAYADSRISRIQNQIMSIRSSLDTATKSSAGDKHETGRAMLQLEREKLGKQLFEAEKMKQVLAQLRIDGKREVIGPGSLVHTTAGDYFIAISAGMYIEGQIKIYCISALSPIGKLLLGKSRKEQLSFNNMPMIIEAVF